MWWHHKQPNLGHIYLWQGKENIYKIFYKTFKNFGIFFPSWNKQIAKDINQSLTLQDALNILQLWQKAFQYKPHATSTQKNSQKTSKKPPVEQTNKHQQQQQKKTQRSLFSNIWTPLWERESRKIISCVYPYIIFIPLSVFMAPWCSLRHHGRSRSGCKATGAENTEFAVYISVAVALDFCGPWSEYPLVTEE